LKKISLLLLLLLIPLNVGCAALPMDGTLLKKVTEKKERAPEIKAIADGESCRCEAVCQ